MPNVAGMAVIATAVNTLQKGEQGHLRKYGIYPLHSRGGVKTHYSPSEKIKIRARRFATIRVRLAYLGQLTSIALIVIIAFFKDDIQDAIIEHNNGNEFLDTFFALEDWIIWIIVAGAFLWSLVQLIFSVSLRRSIHSESAKGIKIWLILNFLNWIGIVILVLALIIQFKIHFYTALALGVLAHFVVFVEIYFVHTMTQLVKIISRNFSDVQIGV